MNKYVRGVVDGITGIVKVATNRLLHGKSFVSPMVCFLSPLCEMTIENGARVSIGKKFRMRSLSRIRVRKGAYLSLGEDISLNHGCIIVCREEIKIGSGTQFGPNVLIYDHDHDYKADFGISAGKYKTEPIIIGNNVWIGAGSIILRGTTIGDNSVVAAGSIIKGTYPSDSLLYQKRITEAKSHAFGK